MISPDYWRFIREEVIPAAVKVAIAKPMTVADRKFLDELKCIYDGPLTK